jgi:ADP-ribosylglycohydrolase
LAFFVDPEKLEERQLIRDVSRITHHSEEAYVGALAIVVAVRFAFLGQWTGGDGLLSHVIEQLPDSRIRDRLEAIEDVQPGTIAEVAERFGCSGYVVDSVPLALFGAQMLGPIGFRDALCSIVEAGGDTDTNASMAGQVMGCAIGFDELPDERAALPCTESVIDIGGRLAEVLRCHGRMG